MRGWLALRLNKALTVTLRSGALRSPGAGRSLSMKEADGRETSVVCTGDAFSVIHGRKEFTRFVTSPKVMRQLMWFLFSWWIFGTWFGLKPSIWKWSTSVLLDEERVRVEAKWHKRAEV